MKVGHSQESCTTAVAFTKTFLIDDNPVVLIDTPGFDNDVDKGLEDVLIDVEAQINRKCVIYFSEFPFAHLCLYSYKGRRITGIIYIHAMDQRRVSRATKREIQAVRVLCGNEPKNSFIIATTMWKEIDASVGVQREEHLKTDIEFFKQFTDMGVKFVRHPDSNGEQDSARNIIRTLLSSARTQATNADAAMNENESSRTSTRSSIAQLLRRLFGKVPSNSSNQSRYTLFK